MKAPRWLRGGSGPGPEPDQDDEGASRGPRDESERAQRERLAKARRERERKARADLAAKARAREAERKERAEKREPPKRASKEEGSEAPKPKSAARRRADPKGRERKGDPTPKGRERKDPVRGRGRDSAAARGGGSPRAKGKRPAAAGAGATALRAVGSVRAQAATRAPQAGRAGLRLLVGFFTIFFALVAGALKLAAAAWRFARGPLRAGLERLGRWTNAVSRVVTPTRALAVVTAAALVLLALAQFADYRSISIGNDAYANGIQTVAPPPVTETDATGSAHSYLMIPLAAAGLVLLGAALTGRRRLCRVVALVGLIAIVVGLLHDRPTGLDVGDRSVAYEGVKATLVGGFYAQLGAGLLIVASSLLLGRELRLAGASSSARGRGRPAAGRLRLRRRTGVQGARA